MEISVLTPLKWGIQWGATHPWELVGGVLLLKTPATRTWALRMLHLAATGVVAAGRGTAVITFQELVVPTVARIAASQVAAGLGIMAAAGVAAGVAAGGVVAAQERVKLVGTEAPKATSPYPSLKRTEFNPFFMGWGAAV